MTGATLHFGHVFQAVVGSIDIHSFDESVEELRALFPDATVIAALDLVDRNH
ncbi:hypothetical protein ID866_7296, partial [Astraeus odoratus]